MQVEVGMDAGERSPLARAWSRGRRVAGRVVRALRGGAPDRTASGRHAVPRSRWVESVAFHDGRTLNLSVHVAHGDTVNGVVLVERRTGRREELPLELLASLDGWSRAVATALADADGMGLSVGDWDVRLVVPEGEVPLRYEPRVAVAGEPVRLHPVSPIDGTSFRAVAHQGVLAISVAAPERAAVVLSTDMMLDRPQVTGAIRGAGTDLAGVVEWRRRDGGAPALSAGVLAGSAFAAEIPVDEMATDWTASPGPATYWDLVVVLDDGSELRAGASQTDLVRVSDAVRLGSVAVARHDEGTLRVRPYYTQGNNFAVKCAVYADVEASS